MSATRKITTRTRRKKLAEGKERGNDALEHETQDTSSSDGSNESGGLPKGWRWVTISEIAESMKNGIYKPASSYEADGVACLRMYNIDEGRIVWRDIKRMRLSEREIREYELLPGDLLVNRVNSRELVGKAAAISARLERCVFESKNIRVRLRRDLASPEFVSYRLFAAGSHYFTQNAQQVVGMASISQPQVARFPLPLPPLPEQRRIVAEIEKQFTRLEAGVAALRRVQSNLKRYRAAVLKTACQGKLVPTESEIQKAEGRGQRDFESGDQLLHHILTERRKYWTGPGKYKEPAAPDPFNLPLLPDGWVYASVEQLGIVGEQAVLTGPFGTNLGREDFTDKGVPMLTISCLTDTGILLDKAAFVTEEKSRELDRYRLTPGDLLFSRMASVGRAGIIGEALNGALFNYHIMRLRLEPTALLAKFYLAYIRGSTQVEDYLRKVNHGATRAGINTEQLLKMPVALPPLAEQTRIVTEVERRLSVAEKLEEAVSANLRSATRLRQSILQKAFTGEL